MVWSEPPTDARDAACRALADQADRFPALAIREPNTSRLDPRDAALAHTIYDQAIRRWLTLECVLNRFLRHPLRSADPRVQAALLAGAVQILLLDRVPAHAAIDQSVAWTKRALRPKPAGLVNAVLRRVAELRVGGDDRQRAASWSDARDAIPLADGTALRLTEPVLPAEASRRLAIATSTPRALLLCWGARIDEARVRAIALGGIASPPTIVNTTWATRPLPDWLTPHTRNGFHVAQSGGGALKPLLNERADLWVQDPASAVPITLAAAMTPALIVDVCAGRGTKTRQLAATFPGAQIIATDIDDDRRRDLAEVFARSDRVKVVDPAVLADRVAARADLVVLDVPCSNTGVLRRRVEARYRASASQLERLVATQQQIMTGAMDLLRSQGRILYATCSLEQGENEKMGDWASQNLGLRVVASEMTWPAGLPGEGAERFSDGAFGLLMARQDAD